MNELQRTEYLTALGVTSYMPRFRLPLAPEPLQAPLPPAADESRESVPPAASVMAAVGANAEASSPPHQPHTEAAPAPAAPSPDMGRVIGSITADARVNTAASQPVTPIAPPQRQVAPFVLSCWRLGNEVLAVDSREPGAALPVESLFGNIVRALGWHQLESERNKLRWPLAENPFAVAAGAEDAKDTCSSWLEAACLRNPVQSIWLMGAQAQEFCAPVALSEAAVNDWQGIHIVSLPSLTELLQEPARKREVWNLLRKQYPEQTRR